MRGHTAKQYDRLSRWLLRWIYRTVAADVTPAVAANGAVLDVGTDPGRLPVELAQRRPDLRLIGVDPSEDMVVLGRANADLRPPGQETRQAGRRTVASFHGARTPHGHRISSLVLRALAATFVAERASETSPT